MAISDSQKVDLLYKKLFGVAKSDTATNKSPSNEATSSPFINRGDKVWVQANSIPSTAASTAGIVQAYQTTSAVQTTADNTTTPVGGVYPTWKTSLTDWIPPEFGATYFISAYAGTTGLSDPTTGVGATKIFDSGSGGTGEWFFDYQAGVLNFIGTTIPAPLTSANTVYITGYRYIGQIGISSIAANTIYTQGVDASQNARMTIIEGTDVTQNTNITLLQGAVTSANANIALLQSGLNTANANGVSTDGKMQSAYNQANVTAGGLITANANSFYIQSGLNSANANIAILFGTDVSQNVRLDYSNSTITIIQGVDSGQNARITIIEGVDATQNTNISNKLNLTGSLNQTVSGNVTIGQDLIVSGNLILTGNINSQNVQQLAVADPLIVLGIGNYVSDTKDIGFAAHYNDGTNAHAGFIRDSATKEFYVFQGYTPELDANNNVDINHASFQLSKLNAVEFHGNVIANTVVVNGVNLITVNDTQNTWITSTDGKMQSAYNQANVTAGGLITANANIAILFGTDVSQNTRLDYSNTAITVVQGVDASQNVRLDYSNVAISIIQGVDFSQNARMAIIEGTDVTQNANIVLLQNAMTSANANVVVLFGIEVSQNANIALLQSGLNTANANGVATDGKMQSAYNQANVTAGGLITANANNFYIQSGLNSANANIAILFGTDASQNVRLDYSNSAITIIQGVDTTQNTRLTVIENTDLSQNVSIATQNSFITVIQGVDVGQNTAISATNQYATSAFSTANNAFTKANNALANTTGTFAGTLTVTGNVIANSFQTSGSSGNISGANFVYANTFVASNAYIFFDGTVQTTAASANLATGAYNQANTATVLAQASYNQANVTIGVDATQNTRLTVAENTDLSQNVRLDFSNTRMTIIDGVDASQNARMVIIEGVDLGQNTAIVATDGKMSSAYNQANTGTVLAQAAFDSANVQIGVDATQNTRISVIEDTDLSQNANIIFLQTQANTLLPNTGTLITVNGSSQLYLANTSRLALQVAGGLQVGGGTVSNPSIAIGASNRGFYNAPGSGSDIGFVSGGYEQVRYVYNGPTVNYITFTGSGSGNTTIIGTAGTDANVSISLLPKGNAAVMITGNTAGYIPASNSIYVGNRVGFANSNNISAVYQTYNLSTNSLDIVFG